MITAKDVMTKEVITVSPETPLMDVIAKMDKNNIQEIPIVNEHKELVGMITYHDILDYIKIEPVEKISRLMIMPPVIKPDTPVEEIARLMLSTGIEAIPVAENKKVVGIVSDYDLMKVIINFPSIKNVIVEEVMKPIEHILKKDDEISVARRIMRYHGVDRIPVVDEEGKNLGLVISTDILKKFIVKPKERMGKEDVLGEHETLLSMPVSSIMRKDIPPVYHYEKVSEALDKLMKMNIKGAAVVDKNNKVVGMFYRWDLLGRIVEKKIEEGVWLKFSGIKLPLGTVDVLKNYLYTNIKKLKRIEPNTESIDCHIKKLHGASKEKWNYEVKVSLKKKAGKKEIVSKGRRGTYGYNLIFTVNDALEKLLKQLERRYREREGKTY